MSAWVKTDKQIQAQLMMAANTFNLLEGGARSGKTIINVHTINLRAIAVDASEHLIVRFRFAHAKKSLAFQTFPEYLRMQGLSKYVRLNKTDWFFEYLTNGSRIWIGGIDDKERTESILGNEYSTIYANESSQISYEAIEILMTRLNPTEGLRPLFLFDYNPPSVNHWGYKIFHKREFPDGRKVPDNDYAWIKINPRDNEKNLSKSFFSTMENLSEAKKRRFLSGEYGLDDGVLWKRHYFHYLQKLPDELLRVVVGVDPAGSVDGDEIGLVVCAQYIQNDEYLYVVLDDQTLHGTPKEWSDAAYELYVKWKADVLVAEKNFGGDMVEFTLRTNRPEVNVKLVTSSRGKIVRAEPISALYEHGRVSHYRPEEGANPFLELEDECCMYKPEPGAKSPNRMDALVFALTELSGEGLSILDVA